MNEHHQSDWFKVQIDSERDTERGWLYTITITFDDGSTSNHELTLAWVDHEHLVGGAIAPSELASRAFRVAAEHFGQSSLPARCDVSILRRVIQSFDDRIKSRI